MKIRTAAALLLLPLLSGCHVIHADPKIAFLGDSITQGWKYPAVNYGIYGNTTEQMRARFPKLIPGHGYTAVVLLGGTNDTLRHIDPAITIQNLEAMGDQIVAQGARPILCEIPPIFHSYNQNDHTDYSPQVAELNRRIVQLANTRQWGLVDYYDPMVGHPGYSSDGVHMKRRGYLVMEQALSHQTSLF